MKETLQDYRLEHLRRVLGDRYRVVGLLGRGAFAAVYLVENVRLERKEALKVLSDAYDESSRFLARFIDEAKLVASLDHTNIVKVYDYGEVEGTLWMSMQYIDGPTLRSEIVSDRQNSPLTVVRMAIALLDALAYSHAQGIVHRDVKPSNILLSRRGEPFLMDFGIAKATRSSLKTMTGSVLGTPAYMAPEQAEGRPLDGRADLYALGSVLYELLAGVPPYEGNDPVHILVQRLRDDPRPLIEAVPSLSPELSAIIMRSLERDPEDRFADALSMQRAFEAWLGGRSAARYRPATEPEIVPLSPAEVHAARSGLIDSSERTVVTREPEKESAPSAAVASSAVASEPADPAAGRETDTFFTEEPRWIPAALTVLAILILVLALAGEWWSPDPSTSDPSTSDGAPAPTVVVDPQGIDPQNGDAQEGDPQDGNPGAPAPEEPADGDGSTSSPEESTPTALSATPGGTESSDPIEEAVAPPPPSPVASAPPSTPPAAPPRIRRPVRPPRIAEAVPLTATTGALSHCAGVSVILSVSVGEDGRALDSRALGAGDPLCQQAARDTAEQYRFEPAVDVEGAPVTASISLSLRFESLSQDQENP